MEPGYIKIPWYPAGNLAEPIMQRTRCLHLCYKDVLCETFKKMVCNLFIDFEVLRRLEK